MISKGRYQLTDRDIVKISALFGNLEDAIKEIIRGNSGTESFPGIAELTFYEEISRVFMDADDKNLLF